MYRHRSQPEWFNAWAKKFYTSKEWKALRDLVREDQGMRCEHCHKLIISGKAICDHIIEVCPDNYDDINITLNRDNLQLLCIPCHNVKTFGKVQCFDVAGRDDVNLF